MKPGPDIIIACPKCRHFAIRKTLMSGNTFNAMLWSDGRRRAPMMPEFPAIAKCTSCSAYFWADEAEKIRTCRQGEQIPLELAEAEPIRFLSIWEYHDAIESGISRNSEDELYLRLRQWWLFNDLYREGRSEEISIEMEEINADNLNHLLEILDKKEDSERVMIAEIYRYREEFEKSRDIINQISEEKFAEVREKILSAIDSRQKGPVLLFGPN